MTNDEEALAIYQRAIDLAKHELDIVLPQYAKLQERVKHLRQFVTSGTRLVGKDVRDEEEKYVNQWETNSYVGKQYNMGNRKQWHQNRLGK